MDLDSVKAPVLESAPSPDIAAAAAWLDASPTQILALASGAPTGEVPDRPLSPDPSPKYLVAEAKPTM
jgi:hypothetical protein